MVYMDDDNLCIRCGGYPEEHHQDDNDDWRCTDGTRTYDH